MPDFVWIIFTILAIVGLIGGILGVGGIVFTDFMTYGPLKRPPKDRR